MQNKPIQPNHALLILLIFTALLYGQPTALASLLAYDGFDYTPGTTIGGQSGGSGWGSAWAVGGAGNFLGTNVAGNLNYTDVNGQSLQTTGGSLVVGNPNGTSATTAQPNRTLTGSLASGTTWISFLYQRLNFTPGPYLRQANLGLFDSSGGGERLDVGGANTSATVSNVLSVWGNGATHSVLAPFQAPNYPVNPGSTYFILVKVIADATTAADTAYVWFNWTNLNVEPDIATATLVDNELNLSLVTALRFQAGNANATGSNAVFQADELRVGTTFVDVTPNGTNALPPSITSQPVDSLVTIGDLATFTVSASGGTPFSYQWYFNTNTPLANQTNAVLNLPNAQTTNAGGYSAIVANSQGSITSRVAVLTVQPPQPPTISAQPADVNLIAGNAATFSVTASGYAPLRYQWYFTTNTPLANQTNATLTIPNAQTNDTGGYSARITNTVGAVTSVVAKLTIFYVGPPGLPAFPGADGAAKSVTGGRGGLVYHVTKLDRSVNDSAVGTLRYGLNDGNFPAGIPRTIVFDVGGTFWLGLDGAAYDNGWDTQSRYTLPRNITLAGQTAPGPVIIMGGTTKPGGTNIIIRNILFAPGYGMKTFHEPPNAPTPGDFPDSYVYDALDISGQNIMIDHCTAVYCTDESVSCNELANQLTIQYCNISQAQNYPQADAENPGVYTGHALGSLLQAGSDAKVSVLNNLYAHDKGRLPRVGSEVGTGAFNDFRNNVFYNWLSTAGTGASGQPSFDNFINNFYLAGPGGDNVSGTNIVSASGGTSIFNGSDSSLTRVFHTGNFKDTNKDGDPNDGVALANSDFGSSAFQSTAYDVNIGATLGAAAAFTNVLRYTGSRWWERPYVFTLGNTNAITTNNIAAYVDERLIRETFTGTGKIIAWADDPFNSDPGEGVEWRSLLALRADASTGAAPFNRPANWDTDGDGMPDAWEIEHGLNPNVANPNGDFDNDGYTDLEEYLNEVAAWPAPGEILFTGANNRYAEIFNWQVNGVVVNIAGTNITTSSKWQPSRFDTAIISNANVIVDAVGQEAGTLRLRDNATLNLTGGWLKVSNTLEIATTGVATANLSHGRLRVGTLTKGAGSGAFNFTGGTLSADVVTFGFTNQYGMIAPGDDDPGQMRVMGNLSHVGALTMKLGGTNVGESDKIIVDGNLTLGGKIYITGLPGFGPGVYTLITYGGALNGLFGLSDSPQAFSYAINTNIPGQIQLVVSGGFPLIKTLTLTNGNFVLSGTGKAYATFYILASTNLALPVNLWTRIATNSFNPFGQFSFSSAINSNQPQTFYRLFIP